MGEKYPKAAHSSPPFCKVCPERIMEGIMATNAGAPLALGILIPSGFLWRCFTQRPSEIIFHSIKDSVHETPGIWSTKSFG